MHLLVQGDFVTQNKLPQRPTHLQIWNFLKNFSEQKKLLPPSSKQVNSIVGYVDYLKVYPQVLIAFSTNFTELAEMGHFHPTHEEHIRNVKQYNADVELNKEVNEFTSSMSTALWVRITLNVKPEAEWKINKMTQADKLFLELRLHWVKLAPFLWHSWLNGLTRNLFKSKIES